MSLTAGASIVDITPERGVQVAGAVGAYRPAKFVEDPLYARALVLESGGSKICIVSADVTIIAKRHSDRIRRWAESHLGFDFDAVMVHATQTHSAPAIGHFLLSYDYAVPEEFEWLRGSNPEYNEFAEERIREAIEKANSALRPVEVGYGSGVEGRMAFNRRAVKRDGRVMMPGPRWKEPLGPTEILYMEGPIDPEVGVVCFRQDNLRFPGIMVNYSCHPVHVFPKPIISPDWPGALADELVKAHGSGCVPLILNGPCGNINPWPPFDPDYVEDHKLMGRVLATTVAKVIEGLEFLQEAAIDYRACTLRIPLREIDEEELDRARECLKEKPDPQWAEKPHVGVDPAWVMAAGLVDLYNLKQRDPDYDYEVQAFRIGDAAIVGLPGEPFVEGALRIKMASPTYPTYVVHDVNHYAGYLPTREAFTRGGHETNTGNWSRFVPEALDLVVDAATALLRELYPSE
jgi:hypothetical protein